MEISKKQLLILAKIRNHLIESFNNKEAIAYFTVRDCDQLIESLISKNNKLNK